MIVRSLLAAALLLASAEARAEDRIERPHPFVQLAATTFLGSGLRFNNPYRLATPLGDDAESISRTATYLDIGLMGLMGDPEGLQHGLAARASLALEGVPQTVFVPSYVLYRRWNAWAAYGRAGVPVVLAPDATAGLEFSLAGVFFVRGGIGVVAETVLSVIYGAGTREVATPAYPVWSGQLGLVFAYEVIP